MNKSSIGLFLGAVFLIKAFWSPDIVSQSHAQQSAVTNAKPPTSTQPGPGENLPVDPGLGPCELDYITDAYMGLERFCSNDVLGTLVCNIRNVLQNPARKELKAQCDEYTRKFPRDPIQISLSGVGITMGALCDILLGLDRGGSIPSCK